jgi:hypothetical protein
MMGADYAVESNYAVTRRKIPDADTGRIYPLNVHGIVYVTRGNSFTFTSWRSRQLSASLVLC